jgi:death on curing protein
MRYLTREQVLRIHARVLAAHGGSDGIRDLGMLDAALQMPESTFDGKLLHPDVPTAAAAYLFHLCQNHPFIDGNKRVATMAMYAFIKSNGYELTLDNDELADLVMSVADSRLNKRELTQRLCAVIVIK